MKNKIYILFTAVLTLVASSCSDDFLEKEPKNVISAKQIEEAVALDPALLNSSVSGLYSTMYNMGTGGTTRHDDFGQKGYDIFSDMLSSDMVLGALVYGWYSDIARYQVSKDFTTNGAYQPWRYYYRIIFAANGVIEALGGNDAELDDEAASLRHFMGQAKAMRAYSYFYLVHFYSKGYGDGTELILPIYLNTKDPDQPLSASADVFQVIIDDLTQAVTLLSDFSRGSKDQVDQWVAKGLLAYAYAARGTSADLQQVVALTEDIILNSGYRLLNEDEIVAKFDANNNLINPQSGFNNVNSPSWIWGVDLTLASNLDLVSWWGQVDLYTYSYAWAGDPKVIDEDLYDAIRNDDLRKQQFAAAPGYPGLAPINKFYASHRKLRLSGSEFGVQRNIIDDYVYMRVEEFYLLNAEAHAKLDQDQDARDRLKELLDERGLDYSYVDALSGSALDDEIYLQTRIELWGEGKSLLAAKRNKATVTRGPNHLFFPGESFTWDSDELSFPIPQAEVLNNPNLGTGG